MVKENLVWQIDLLEGKLEKDTRLFRAKKALEKSAKKSDKNKAPKEDLEKEVIKLKRKLVDRKIHHGQKSINRELKSALRLEKLKLKRKQAKEPKEQHEKELKQLDEMNADDLAPVIATRTIKKHYMKTKNYQENPPAFLSSSIVQQVLDLNNSKHSDIENNIISRLVKAGGVHKACEDLVRSINNAARINKDEKVAQRAGDESDSDEEVKDIRKAEAKLPKKDSSKDAIVEDEDEDEDDGEVVDDEDEEEEEEEDPFMMPALATGYISGSDDDEADRDVHVKSLTEVRKNRRGQRARRKIWEMKYGNRANHRIQEEKEEAAQAAKKAEKERRKEMQRNRQSQEKQKFDAKPLHPSWEAKKATAAPVKFEGKKITF